MPLFGVDDSVMKHCVKPAANVREYHSNKCRCLNSVESGIFARCVFSAKMVIFKRGHAFSIRLKTANNKDGVADAARADDKDML